MFDHHCGGADLYLDLSCHLLAGGSDKTSVKNLLDSKDLDSGELPKHQPHLQAFADIPFKERPKQSFLQSLPRDDSCYQYIEEEDMGLPEHIVAAENLTETVKVGVVASDVAVSAIFCLNSCNIQFTLLNKCDRAVSSCARSQLWAHHDIWIDAVLIGNEFCINAAYQEVAGTTLYLIALEHAAGKVFFILYD